MSIGHSNITRLALHSKINRAYARLAEFMEAHRQTAVKPWTDKVGTKHKSLLTQLRKAVNELHAFEHPSI